MILSDDGLPFLLDDIEQLLVKWRLRRNLNDDINQ
jgi:hypothetical protein